MEVGDLVIIREPRNRGTGLVMNVKSSGYGWSFLVLLLEDGYYETNTLHCEIAKETHGKSKHHCDERTYQKRD